ncbi:hypothetical protein CC1G_00828 [Coprinopsis cinerea okayama7|uniref:Malate dehydrogenase n=1 Tax=Coprinopsis cinerea (strain Okayama-7 / 130 / ATCC MYA-4618 / FGSC 9003) TaxID=240176 RepID=A8N8V3_COPC7|nr:hypothetical protein CC1G_00828 [Coprinopsis cinerea okayama7\|eukprot:XP_001831281.1 hypothetical protein CC1G_00828 [Coprinopsis cinerea okayama7\
MYRFAITVLLALSAIATPIRNVGDPARHTLVVPAGLATPRGPASAILLGVGVQNYTCTEAGTYAAAGAVAELFDISNLDPRAFQTSQDVAMEAWTRTAEVRSANAVRRAIRGNIPNAGEHYFVTSPSGTGISPIWDQRSNDPRRNNPDAFVIGAKAGGIPAPTGPQDVDWLEISNVQGKLARTVYRTDTRGGPAPASCIPGSPVLSVKYTSKYWLFGSTL